MECLVTKLNEAITDTSLRKLNEIRFPIKANGDKSGSSNFSFAIGAGTIKLGSAFGNLRFKSGDNWLPSLDLTTVLQAEGFVVKVMATGDDYLTISPSNLMVWLSTTALAFFVKLDNNAPTIASIDRDSLYALWNNQIVRLGLGAMVLEDITTKWLADRFSFAQVLIANGTTITGDISDFATNNRLTHLQMIDSDVHGDILSLSNLNNLNFFSLGKIMQGDPIVTTYSGTASKVFNRLYGANVRFNRATADEINNFVGSLSKTDWIEAPSWVHPTGANMVYIYTGISGFVPNSSYVTELQAKGVTITFF